MSKFSESNFLKFTTQNDFENEPKYSNYMISFQDNLISKKYNPISVKKKQEIFTQYKEIKILNLELENLIHELIHNNYYEYKGLLGRVKNIEKIYVDLLEKYGDVDIKCEYIKSLKKIRENAKSDQKTFKLLNNLIISFDRSYY